MVINKVVAYKTLEVGVWFRVEDTLVVLARVELSMWCWAIV